MKPGDELVDVVGEADEVIGCTTRHDMRRRGLRHRAAYVLVFNPEGKLFVHRRTATKDVYPSHYDVAAGGVVEAGEGYDAAAARELREELGIEAVQLRRLFAFRFAKGGAPVNGMVYSCTYGGPLRLQASEIESGDWLDLDEVIELAQREAVCPDSMEALRLYLARLEAAARKRR